jgi:hypothetical protein
MTYTSHLQHYGRNQQTLSLDIFTTTRRFLPVQKWGQLALPMQWDTPPKEYPSPVITPAYFGRDILQQPVSPQNEYTYVSYWVGAGTAAAFS